MIVISNQDHDKVILMEMIFFLLIYLYFHSTLIKYYYLYYKHIIGTFSYRNILKLAFLESIL